MAAPDPTYAEAIARLGDLYREAHGRELAEPNAATLATADLRGRPSIRTVSVMAVEEDGPVFLHDRRSGKGRQLADNPCAALCFFWPQLQHQVVVEGHARRAGDATSDRCWARRPRERQIAAWVSDDEGTDAALARLRQRFGNRPIPRPPQWQALYLEPEVLLFWKLSWRHPHARERYARAAGGGWQHDSVRPL